MAFNCDSCTLHSNALPNNRSPSTYLQSASIHFTDDLNVETQTQMSNPSAITSTSQSISNNVNGYARCVHGCKEEMYRLMRNEPNRIKFQPINYSGESSVAKLINENFSVIVVDGSANHHLMICKCNRLMARHQKFEKNTKRHLGSEVHSKGCRTSSLDADVNARIDLPHEKIVKIKSRHLPQSRNPSMLSNSEPKEQVPPPAKLVPTSTNSIPLSQDFLIRKRKLEKLLWIEPPPFVFMPAISLPSSIGFTREVFNEFAIPGFQTDDLIVCTSCVSILNNYPNDIWNVDTHAGTYCHFENVRYNRGIQVNNFDFNILKRHFT